MSTPFRLGKRVLIVAKDDFYSFVDGWTGYVSGYASGGVWVDCVREDGTKSFLVPAEQLRLLP
ncbi:hypothetical protein [Ralstonia pickettii]|uniref:hypothetical protein n=1 Tax=Ralstonia pickettii TaxID=329 RepID=UPI000818C35B|nr:hypothetical protein [Ralstonia pickettii]OCS48830.1 hypothetical protein BEK67_19625 [Ralstonia pickettii]